jgi:hypothetical protein
MIDQNEFINAYIQRMLALNSELTNKNVMLETRYALLEKKFNEVAEQYNAMVLKYEPPAVNTVDPVQEPEQKTTKTSKKEDSF